MTVLEWVGVLSVGAAWTAIIVGIMTTLHGNSKVARREMEDRLTERMTAQEAAADRAHEAIAEQVRDMANQMRQGYVDRREFDTTVRSVETGMTQLGRDIGGVRNEVDKVGRRIDDMMQRGQWRRDRNGC